MIVLCTKSELSKEFPLRVELDDGREIAVFCVGEEVFAIEDLCSHGSAALSTGYVEGFEVVCPYHHGRFDIRTGAATSFPCVTPVRSFQVIVQGDDVCLVESNS